MIGAHSFLLISLMFGHWFADFVCQTRWMAENKSKSFKALSAHVLVYSLVITFYMWYREFFVIGIQRLTGTGTLTEHVPAINFLWFFLATFATHWITDAITSRITSFFHKKGNTKAFFTTIGFDQYLHFIALWWCGAIWLIPWG